MVKLRDGKTNTSVAVDDKFKAALKEEGMRMGVGWTTMLMVAAREGLAIRAAEERSRNK